MVGLQNPGLVDPDEKRDPHAPHLGCILPTYMVSALHNDGVDDMKQDLLAAAPLSPWAYHSSVQTDLSELARVEEMIREELYVHLHEELPYRVVQENRGWTEMEDGSLRIDQDLVVARDSQKGILIGKGGSTLRDISTQARIKLEGLMDRRVHLMLRVRVSKGPA